MLVRLYAFLLVNIVFAIDPQGAGTHLLAPMKSLLAGLSPKLQYSRILDRISLCAQSRITALLHRNELVRDHLFFHILTIGSFNL